MGKSTRLLVVILLFLTGNSFAQGFNPYQVNHEPGPHPMRVFLNQFSLEFSSGYNLSYYYHRIQGYALTNYEGRLYLLDNSLQSTFQDFPSSLVLNNAIKNWVNDPTFSNIDEANPDDVLINTDTASFYYRSFARGVPVNVNLHFTYWIFRGGLGASLEFQNIGTFTPSDYDHKAPEFQMANNSTRLTRLYGILGAKVWSFNDYSFIVDTHFGRYTLGPNFNTDKIDHTMFANVGVVVEKELSEYFRAFGRVSYESKGYRISIPESNYSFAHNIPTLSFNIGLSFSYPEIDRCKNSACHVRMVHKHGTRQYRGQPFYRKQNSGYGEFHPNLLKHKYKNKRIRNPF